MAAHADNKAVAFSEKVFEQLLAAYPRAHLEEYGAAMAQLFRDQCRDAWNESRGWGLARLWLRVLPDVIGTSLSEHLEAIKERKFMLNRISTLFRSAQSFKFFTVFSAVFLLVVIAVTIVTFILPESFRGTARIIVHHDPTGFVPLRLDAGANPYYFIQADLEVMQSEAVLSKVVHSLALDEKWGRKYTGKEKLKTSECVKILKQSIELRPLRNTSLIEIRAYSNNSEEAAQLANGVADAYRDYEIDKGRESMKTDIIALKAQSEKTAQEIRTEQTAVDQLDKNFRFEQVRESQPHAEAKKKLDELLQFQKALEAHIVSEEADLKLPKETMIEILDRQITPDMTPVKPNKTVNIIAGIFLGTLLGLIAGGGVAGISFLVRRNSPPKIAS